MGSSPLTPEEARQILREMDGQDAAIFSVYAYTLAKARTLRMFDLRTTDRNRHWVRLQRRNNTETWHQLPTWLWYKLLERPLVTTLSGQFDHPVFASPQHPDRFYSIQELNRKLRRYARLAGVHTDIRIQDLRGVLMEQEVIEPEPENPVATAISSRIRDPRLHGIGRRSLQTIGG